MLITRRSIVSGVERTLEVPVEPEQLARWERGEDVIQKIMPDLDPMLREFVMTGVTADEWDETFRDEEERDA